MSGVRVELPIIGVTLGDPAGIGPEVVAKALSQQQLRQQARYLLLGDADIWLDAQKRFRCQVPAVFADDFAAIPWSTDHAAFLPCAPRLDLKNFHFGKIDVACARSAMEALRAAAKLAQNKQIHALVTAPVNKTAFQAAGYPYEGQTEFLGELTQTKRLQMVLLAENLRILLLSRHLSLRAALEQITAPRIVEHLFLAQQFCAQIGIAQPRLAVAGVNPHAGEGGIFGDEEKQLLIPAIQQARQQGLQVSDPISPDAVFRRALAGEFDLVLAMYHDQAFIPVKLIGFQKAITSIAGLPFLRISVVHGTAFDIAGKGIADATNMSQALQQTINLLRQKH